MGFFNGILGGVIGGEMASAVDSLIEKHGGIQGIVSQMQAQGLGSTVSSWVGPGANVRLSVDQLHQAFGAETIQGMASKLGLDPADFARRLSQVLPQAIDHLTPNGVVPS
jgi:uncharacterized protein YidB (DUF937 family)